jgi:hypothetical protein
VNTNLIARSLLLLTFTLGPAELASDDPWSDDEAEASQVRAECPAGYPLGTSAAVNAPSTASVQELQAKLAASEAQIERLKQLLESTLQADSEDDSSTGCSTSSSGESDDDDEDVKLPSKAKSKADGKAVNRKGKKVKRDDDTHYFDSYAQNGTSIIWLCKDDLGLISNCSSHDRDPRDHAERYHPDHLIRPFHPRKPRHVQERGRDGRGLRYRYPF